MALTDDGSGVFEERPVSELEKLLKPNSVAATPATPATFATPSAVSSNSSKGSVLDFDREKARRDAQKRDEARRKRLEPVLKMMTEDNQAREFYCVTDDKVDPDYVILTFAIRGKGSGELSIPKEKYDAFKLLEILEEAGS